ncbi:MAG: S1C family serine protease [Suipraeoptans sp.]
MDDKEHKHEEQESEKKESPEQLGDEQNNKDHEEYAFLQETIKDESGGNRKNVVYITKLVCKGLIFGLAASLVFSVSKPWFDETFKEESPTTISIPDEDEENEEVPEETEETEPEEPDQTPEEEAAAMEKNITQLKTKAARGIQKSLVDIRGYTEGEQWVEESYDNINSVTGVIMADNGGNLLIFAKSSVSRNATSITATFADEKEYNAGLLIQDTALGYGIYTVNKSDLSDTTSAQISVATLGSTTSVSQGASIIVAGSPFGYSGAIGFGAVAHIGNEVNQTDGSYKIINTDIAASGNGTGVIANMSGEIIAIVDQSISTTGAMNLVTGYAITDIAKKAELLLNNKNVPYLGIQGVNAANEDNDEIPSGIYVKMVENDSPAMAAGIQQGDIITEIDGKEVSTFKSFMDEIISNEVGKNSVVKGYRIGAGNEYVDVEFSITTSVR